MIPYIQGRVARQAHVGIPDGLIEEEYGRAGFGGRYAHLYRKNPPVGWSRIEGPLRPRAFRVDRQGHGLNDTLLANDDVAIGFVRLAAPMDCYVRNADADDLFFVHRGTGVVETDFGVLDFSAGDYLHVPRGTLYRWVPKDATGLLRIETSGQLEVPERGLLGQHALFDPAVVTVPRLSSSGATSSLTATDGEWEVRIKRLGVTTSVFYPFCPMDTVGWKGNLCPTKLNVADIRPVMCERYHLPPSAHATFVADGVIVCTFLPRGLETGDPTALKVPFYHANIDYDEVIFYHDGNFFSRAGVEAGTLTLHPQGIHHGPQPGAVERARDAESTDEVAVMIDTRRPLAVATTAAALEVTDYWKSWGAK